MSQYKAAILPEKGAQLVVDSSDFPRPASHDILVKVAAIATNPVDWKIQAYGAFVQAYPFVLGSDVAGTVEAVGDAVTHFKKGDRVTGFAGSIATGKMEEGAFQEYVILRDNASAKLPDQITFEEGAILPMSVATAGIGFHTFLGLPKQLGEGKQKGGFLVWGGSSSVGTAAVQMAKSMGFDVYATCSPSNNEYVKKLGAKEVFSYKDSDIAAKIVAVAREQNQEIKYAFDAIGEHGSQQACAEVLEGFGEGGKLVATLDWPSDVNKPAGIELSRTAAFLVVDSDKETGKYLFNEWLETALEAKTYTPSPAIEIVQGGLHGIQKALDLHKAGVSSKKLVVQVSSS